MSLDSWMKAKPGGLESAEVFAQLPFKSRQFLAVTTVVLLSVLLGIIAIIRLYGRISWSPLFLLGLGVLTVLGNWLRVMVVHQRLHETYFMATPEFSLPGPQMDTALRASATLCYWGAIAAAATNVALLGALVQILKPIR